jgi:hypothetical protein
MKHLISTIIFGVFLGYSQLSSAVIIDFENNPSLPTGPSLFALAGPEQIINVGGFEFSGGVVLGLPTFLPATPYATTPNLYATANHPSGGAVGDPSLSSTLSITIDPLLSVTTVEGLLFNGLLDTDSFTINAFSGATLVDSISLLNMPSNLNSGFDIFKLDSGGSAIDLVTIDADLSGPYAGEWDYFIDTIAFNEPITNAIPEPTTLLLFAFGLLLVARLRATKAVRLY